MSAKEYFLLYSGFYQNNVTLAVTEAIASFTQKVQCPMSNLGPWASTEGSEMNEPNSYA